MTSASPHAALTLLAHRLECIAPLSLEERHAVEQLPVRVHTLGPRHDIVHDGDTPSQCCLLLEGWAFRYKLLGEGRRQILSFHVPGDLPDLQSLHLQPIDYSLATLTRATVAFIPHENLLGLAKRSPGLAATLWRAPLIEGAVFRAWMTGMGQRSAFGRMAHLFCELYRRLEAVGLATEHRCSLPITQAEFGSALGLSNVHINRVLQELRAQGLITLHGPKLVIVAWERLVQAAEFNPAYLHLTARANT
jgi:CRP-like cAMP-binding protein